MRINVAHLKRSSENTWLVCVLAYIKTTTDVDQRNESEKNNSKKNTANGCDNHSCISSNSGYDYWHQ
jgi:hypothetical protein